MKTSDLVRITKLQNQDVDELLEQALIGDIALFTKVKEDVTVYCDQVKQFVDIQGNKRTSIIKRKAISTNYFQGQTLALPTQAVEKLLIDHQIDTHCLSVLFAPGAGYQLHSNQGLHSIQLRDVFTNDTSSGSLKKKKVGRKKSNHRLAIEEALAILGETAEVDDIFDWIKKESRRKRGDHMDKLSFVGTDEFSTPLQEAVVMLDGTSEITKQNFQNKVSKLRK